MTNTLTQTDYQSDATQLCAQRLTTVSHSNYLNPALKIQEEVSGNHSSPLTINSKSGGLH